MKVAHVINSLNRGGAESHLLELVKAQSNTGLTTDVIVIGEDSSDILSIKKELSSVCRKIYRLKGPRMFNIFSYIKLQKIIRNNSYDVIHSHQPRSDFMVYLLKKYLFGDGRWGTRKSLFLFEYWNLSAFVYFDNKPWGKRTENKPPQNKTNPFLKN